VRIPRYIIREVNGLLGIDLNNLVHQLDSTASDIVSHQRDSLIQRKDLAQKTKDFRKLDDTGKIGRSRAIKGL
jgi:homeobox protein cut-like